MKSSSIRSLQLNPKLRAEAESVLERGETLADFVEQSLRVRITHRRAQREFVARGLASRDQARQTNEYFSADEVLLDFDVLLGNAATRTD